MAPEKYRSNDMRADTFGVGVRRMAHFATAPPLQNS